LQACIENGELRVDFLKIGRIPFHALQIFPRFFQSTLREMDHSYLESCLHGWGTQHERLSEVRFRFREVSIVTQHTAEIEIGIEVVRIGLQSFEERLVRFLQLVTIQQSSSV